MRKPQRARALSRRVFLKSLLAAGAGALANCVPGQGGPTATPRTTLTDAPTGAPPTGRLASTATAAPTGTAAASATISATAPHAATATAAPSPSAAATASAAEKIKSVIFFIQENHTFDSLFAGFPGTDSMNAGQACPDRLPADPPHQHTDSFHTDAATTTAARCSYTEASAETYWQLARQFTLCDKFFSDVRGPSHPNYFMMTSAQTPIVNTPNPTDECPQFCYDVPTLADRLDAQKLTWRDYGGILTDIKGLQGRPEVMDRQDAQYFSDAAAGNLPNFSWLNSDFLENGDALSGHPVGSLCLAQQYATKVINAAMASPQWESIAMFLVWDDWGGFYDHVVPPTIEKWSDGTPLRYGFRVPCIAIGPYARSGYVSHETHSFVSVLRFAETVYGLEPLNERDGSASNLFDCFDFSQQPVTPAAFASPTCA